MEPGRDAVQLPPSFRDRIAFVWSTPKIRSRWRRGCADTVHAVALRQSLGRAATGGRHGQIGKLFGERGRAARARVDAAASGCKAARDRDPRLYFVAGVPPALAGTGYL